MSEMYPYEKPEEEAIELGDGRVVRAGDRVIVTRVYRDDTELARLGVTNESEARYIGSHIVIVDDDGRARALFGGYPIPLIEVSLADGSVEQLLGYECDWSPLSPTDS